jgi:hypothetical protein
VETWEVETKLVKGRNREEGKEAITVGQWVVCACLAASREREGDERRKFKFQFSDIHQRIQRTQGKT